MRTLALLALLQLIIIGGPGKPLPPPTPGDPAADITAESCSQAHVETAIAAAESGDIVAVPMGSCAWASAVDWTDKNLTLRGAGIDSTVITCGYCIHIISNATDSTYSHSRLTGFTFLVDTGGVIAIRIEERAATPTPNYGWRIDHIELDYVAGSSSADGIIIYGPTYGLIDHIQMDWTGLMILTSTSADADWPPSVSNPTGHLMFKQPLDLGTINAVYIEDSEFIAQGFSACYDTSGGGGRAVFRYNRCIGSIYYSHWTRGTEIGGILHEVYNNEFEGNEFFSGNPVRLESGTGVIFNNQSSGYTGAGSVVIDERRGGGFGESGAGFLACDGTHDWDGNAGDEDAPGWPCLGQIGRAPGLTMAQIAAGTKQASSPLYLWNNGPEAGCRTGGACSANLTVFVYDNTATALAYVKTTAHPNGEKDFVNNGATPMPGYTAFTYPHPLQGS